MRFFIFLLGFCLMSTAAQADIYMKQKQHQDETTVRGQTQPAEDRVNEVWITKKGMRSNNAKHSMIMLPDEGKMIMVDRERNRYREMPMNMGDVMNKGMDDADAEEKAAFQGMMGKMMKMEVKVLPTDEKKKIKQWNCRKYLMTMAMFGGTVKTEIWATEDIKIDPALYEKYQSGRMFSMPGVQQAMEEMEKETKKIKGVQVMSFTSSKMMGQTVKSSTELLEYKQTKAPANVFSLPDGCIKEEPGMGGGSQPPSGQDMPRMPKGLFGKGSSSDSDPTEEDFPAKAEENIDLKSLLNVFK